MFQYGELTALSPRATEVGVLAVGAVQGGCTQEEDGEEGRQAGREVLCAHSPLPAWLLATVPCAVFAQGSSGSRWLDVLILSPSTCSAFQVEKRCPIFLGSVCCQDPRGISWNMCPVCWLYIHGIQERKPLI